MDMGNGTLVSSFLCNIGISRYEGNPYLPFGCKLNKVCASCKDGEYCDYTINYDGEGFNFTCIEGYKYYKFQIKPGVIL
ncbi:hypothetical protein Ccrd_026773, partial [Cynara cardunculus var. scolymus]